MKLVKRILIILTVLLLILFCSAIALIAAPVATAPVSTNSVTLLPKRGALLKSAATYATGTVYAAGSYVKNAAGTYYFAWTGGTSGTTNEPTHLHGSEMDDAITWVRVEPGNRLNWTIYNSGTNVLWTSLGSTPAVAGSGRPLAVGAYYEGDGLPAELLQWEVRIISPSTNGAVTIQDQ